MLGARARITIVPPYIIIYDHNHTAVSILRVLHGKSNISAALLARPLPPQTSKT
jgi:plasmid stabilization system protein ParE